MTGSLRHVLVAAVSFLSVAALATPASAELVRLTNGRIIAVAACRFDGEFVVLEFHSGGEVRMPKALISELLPDEVPYAKPFALEALKMSVSAAGPQLAPAAIRALVGQTAARMGVDAKLAHAVVQVESNYDPKAMSSKGAMGLMQIMPVIVTQYAVDDPYDPAKNLEAGLRHLRGLIDRFGVTTSGLRLALAAYNAGETAVSRYRGVPPYRETQDYVRRVLALVR
jgi:transglycosylase-like protein with SLT domain